MEEKDIDDIKCMTKGKNKREMLANDGYYGVAKLTACHIIIWLQRIYPIVISVSYTHLTLPTTIGV